MENVLDLLAVVSIFTLVVLSMADFNDTPLDLALVTLPDITNSNILVVLRLSTYVLVNLSLNPAHDSPVRLWVDAQGARLGKVEPRAVVTGI